MTNFVLTEGPDFFPQPDQNNSGDDLINALAGADTIDGGFGNDTIDGGAGNDQLLSVFGNNVIIGGAGTDFLVAGNGDDVLDGGSDFDDLFGGDGNDALFGGRDSDGLNGGPGNDLVDGGKGDDFIQGGSGDDVLEGGHGNDNLDGGSGIDAMNGGEGNDTYIVDTPQDFITELEGENAGEEDLVISYVDYQLGPNIEFLNLSEDFNSGRFAINGSGNDLDNRIIGNRFPNNLFGAAGDDTLEGGDGNDTLTGGVGSDRFSFGSDFFAPFDPGFFGIDLITDFEKAQGDKIALNQSSFPSIGGTLDESEFAIITNDDEAVNNPALIIYNPLNGRLFYNPNGIEEGFGAGESIFAPPERGGIFAILQNTPNLDVNDFVVTEPDFGFPRPIPLPVVDDFAVPEPAIPEPIPSPVAIEPVPEVMEDVVTSMLSDSGIV
ncbi:calcium-binding protein [Okeania sp. KiyG1]|uniref:calcium-binding protein n=1 Tax=Okeania sp. KiyG1 TaxID=2720165 RepID=UPI001924F48D|nr:calcium-binding protein [Okeania sp. KiyG1]GGA00533.1 hypothetical protein CYANOKiyG1_12200 [Okeania sp. KiyG1]